MNTCPRHKLRSDLPPLPPRIARLPVDERGYPVPWFVQWVDENNEPTRTGCGRPEFRVVDSRKLATAVKSKLCMVCGQPLGAIKVSVLGPMCCITRTTAEPPNHKDCAEFSAMACPFLTKPQMVRREDEFVKANRENVAGEMITRNPGVCALWAMKNYSMFRDGKGGVLFKVGEPLWVKWYALGKSATRAQVMKSIETGIPFLQESCHGIPEELFALGEATGAFLKSGLLPV